MKSYKVVYIDFPAPSFKWANGLYAIIKRHERRRELEICEIRNGIPDLDDDGNFIIGVTGMQNYGITETNLILKV